MRGKKLRETGPWYDRTWEKSIMTQYSEDHRKNSVLPRAPFHRRRNLYRMYLGGALLEHVTR